MKHGVFLRALVIFILWSFCVKASNRVVDLLNDASDLLVDNTKIKLVPLCSSQGPEEYSPVLDYFDTMFSSYDHVKSNFSQEVFNSLLAQAAHNELRISETIIPILLDKNFHYLLIYDLENNIYQGYISIRPYKTRNDVPPELQPVYDSQQENKMSLCNLGAYLLADYRHDGIIREVVKNLLVLKNQISSYNLYLSCGVNDDNLAVQQYISKHPEFGFIIYMTNKNKIYYIQDI